MKKKLNIVAFATNMLLLTLLACLMYNTVGAIAFSLVVLGCSQLFFKTNIGTAAFGVQQEIWIADIMETLFEINDFLKDSIDHSGFVNNKTVHIPQSGGAPNIQVNRSSLPGTIIKRTDTDLTYNIDEYTTDPVVITDYEQLQLSYSKRQSVIGQHLLAIAQQVGYGISNAWGAATKIIRTNGSVSDGTALAPGATGTRKRVDLGDIQALAQAMDKDNIPNDGNRELLMPVDMYYQLFPQSASATDVRTVSAFTIGKATLPQGRIDSLFGFKISLKPTVAVYDTTATKKAVGTATAVTDNLAAIAWHPKYVARAIGSIKVFADVDRAEYYGSIFSAMVPAGGRILRTDEKGVFTLVQQ